MCCPCPPTRCVPISSCQTIQGDYRATKSINTERKEAALARLRSLICDKRKKTICCPMNGSSVPSSLSEQEDASGLPPSNPQQGDASNLPSFLPKQGDGCGTSGNPQRIVGGKTTIPGEFPWAAMVGHSRKRIRTVNNMTFRCKHVVFCMLYVVGLMRRGGHVAGS